MRSLFGYFVFTLMLPLLILRIPFPNCMFRIVIARNLTAYTISFFPYNFEFNSFTDFIRKNLHVIRLFIYVYVKVIRKFMNTRREYNCVQIVYVV